MVDEIARYSDADLAEFKELILKKISKAQFDLDLIKSAYMNDLNNGTDDTSPTFKVITYFANRDSLTRYIDSKNPGDCHINTY